MICRPPTPPRPCECGCGEPIAQKQRGGSPKRFASDACAERAKQAREADLAARREEYQKYRPRHLAYLKARRADYTEHNRRWRERHPTANAEACRRWRQKRRQKLAASSDSE